MKDKVILSLESYHELLEGSSENDVLESELQRTRALLATVIMDNGGTISVTPESMDKYLGMMVAPWYIATRPDTTDVGVGLILSLHEINT